MRRLASVITVLVLIFILGCATTKSEVFGVIGSDVYDAAMDGDEMQINYVVRVTDNCKNISITYDFIDPENGEQYPLEYSLNETIPWSVRRGDAVYVDVFNTLWIDVFKGELIAHIHASSNKPSDKTYGYGVTRRDTINLHQIYNEFIQ